MASAVPRDAPKIRGLLVPEVRPTSLPNPGHETASSKKRRVGAEFAVAHRGAEGKIMGFGQAFGRGVCPVRAGGWLHEDHLVDAEPSSCSARFTRKWDLQSRSSKQNEEQRMHPTQGKGGRNEAIILGRVDRTDSGSCVVFRCSAASGKAWNFRGRRVGRNYDPR